jgi:polar amino acid transport system substrate-binding protein
MKINKPAAMLLLSLCAAATYAAASTLSLNVTGHAPLNTDDQSGFIDRVTTLVFQRLDINIETVNLPAERGLLASNSGLEDGEMSRVAGLEKTYPNLIRVPESIMQWEFVAVGKSRPGGEFTWDSLKHKHVAIINGWKILENKMPPETKLVKVKYPKQLFKMLQRDRVDYIVYENWGARQFLQEYQMTDAQIIFPPLETKNMYIYLHKKHNKLVPEVARILHAIKQDGTYQSIKQKTLKPYLN